MKYLLVAHYAGFDMDDPEDFVNNSWLVGEANTEEEVKELAEKEINNYIDEQAESRFDDPEDIEDIEDFRNEFETSVYGIRNNDTMQVVANLHLDAEFYFEDIKVSAIKVGE